MAEKPDYVLNFKKPAHTEIKYINGHWYLYNKITWYDRVLKKTRKKSGPIIGAITPDGLVRSKHRNQKNQATTHPWTTEPIDETGNSNPSSGAEAEAVTEVQPESEPKGMSTSDTRKQTTAKEQTMTETQPEPKPTAVAMTEMHSESGSTDVPAPDTSKETTTKEQTMMETQPEPMPTAAVMTEVHSESGSTDVPAPVTSKETTTKEQTMMETQPEPKSTTVAMTEMHSESGSTDVLAPDTNKETTVKEQTLTETQPEPKSTVANMTEVHSEFESSSVATHTNGNTTELKFVDSKYPTREDRMRDGSYTPNIADIVSPSSVDAGSVNFLISITGEIRTKLAKYFPKCWKVIYAIAMLRAIYGYRGRFSRLERQYKMSMTSIIYPNLILNRTALTEFLPYLGSQREAITDFMSDVGSIKGLLLIDVYKIVSHSTTMQTAKRGYDSKGRKEKLIDIVYAAETKSDGLAIPTYYKQLSGSTADVICAKDIINEIQRLFPDHGLIFVGDKGTGSVETCNDIVRNGCSYIFAFKRGSAELKGKIPDTRVSFGPGFMYHGRKIEYRENIFDGYKLITYLDYELLKSEKATEGRISDANTKNLISKYTKNISDCEKQEKKAKRKADSLCKRLESNERRLQIAQDQVEEANKRLASDQEAFDKAMKNAQEKRAAIPYASTDSQKQNAVHLSENAENKVAKKAVILEKSKAKANERIEELQKANSIYEQVRIAYQEAEKKYEEIINTKKYNIEKLDELKSCMESSGSPTLDANGNPVCIDTSAEVGTFTLKTNRLNDTAEDIFLNYKLRTIIEDIFNIYANTLGCDSSYMRDPISEEGWLFLNNISSLMSVLVLKKIADAEKLESTSYRTLMTSLSSIRATCVAGKWSYDPIDKKLQDLCNKLGFDPEQTPFAM